MVKCQDDAQKFLFILFYSMRFIFDHIWYLSLSAVDKDGKVIFDNLRGDGDGLLPYTPHTIGSAGIFYLSRFSHLLLSEVRRQRTENRNQGAKTPIG